MNISRVRNRRRAAGCARYGLIICSLLLAACGSKLSDAEVLRANGVTGGSGTTATRGAGATTASGGTELPETPGANGTSESGSATAGGTTGTGGSANTAGAGTAAGPTVAAGAVGTPGETGPIVLGSVGNLGGPLGLILGGIPRGLQVWAQNINANGGLFGREVQVIVADDGGDPARQASLVQDLVENRHVVAFVAQTAAVTIDGSRSFLEARGVPVIGSECANPVEFQSPVIFPHCPLQVVGPWMGAFFRMIAQQTGATRVAALYCIESSVCSGGAAIIPDAAAAAGMQFVYGAGISLTQPDFTAQCQAAQRAGAEVMFVGADPNSLIRVARSCSRQGFNPRYIQPHITSNRDSVSNPGLENLIAGLVTFPFTGISSPAFNEFQQAMDSAGITPSGGETVGWAAAKLFELAATRAAQASQSISPQTLLAAMRTMRGETLGGLTTTLDFSGATPQVASCVFTMVGDGKGGWTAPYGADPFC